MDARIKASVRTSKIGSVCWPGKQRRHDARIVGAGFIKVGRDQGGAEGAGDGGLASSGIVPVDEYETDVCIAVDTIELAVLDLDDDGRL